MASSNPNNTSATDVVETFERIVSDANDCLENADTKIQIQCEYLKDEIEISFESTIDELTKLKQNLFNEIDEYEVKCKENTLNTKAKEVIDFKNALTTCKAKLPTFKDTDADEISSLKSELKKYKDAFNRFIFSDRIMQLRERTKSIDPNILGVLFYQKYTNRNQIYIVDIERLQALVEPELINYKLLNANTHTIAHVHKCLFYAICNNQFFICTDELQPGYFGIGLKIFSKNGILTSNNYENLNLRLVAACAFDRFIVIVVHDNLHNHKMKLYDEELNLVKELSLNYIPVKVTTDGKRIFLLSYHHAPYLFSYDMGLDVVQCNIQLTATTSSELYVRGSKLYIRDNFNWRFMIYNIDNGQFLNQISLPMVDSITDIDMGSNIVLINKMQKKLIILKDTTAQVLYERPLNSLPTFVTLSITENGSIAMHDHFVQSFFVY